MFKFIILVLCFSAVFAQYNPFSFNSIIDTEKRLFYSLTNPQYNNAFQPGYGNSGLGNPFNQGYGNGFGQNPFSG